MRRRDAVKASSVPCLWHGMRLSSIPSRSLPAKGKTSPRDLWRGARPCTPFPTAGGGIPLVALGEGATLEAIHWYVSERSKYSDHGLMAAEYPSGDVEAFVHSGARVFDKYKVEDLRRECRAPLMRGRDRRRRPLR